MIGVLLAAQVSRCDRDVLCAFVGQPARNQFADPGPGRDDHGAGSEPRPIRQRDMDGRSARFDRAYLGAPPDLRPCRPRALDMLEIGRPDLDWLALAKGMGVRARRVTTLDEFASALRDGLESAGPNLIEVPL